MSNVRVVDHPLLHHALTILRDRDTGLAEFQRHGLVAAKLLLTYATESLPTRPRDVLTPVGPHSGKALADDVVFVVILRAALSMLHAAQELFPNSAIGFLGLQRDEATAVAKRYYVRVPPLAGKHVFLLDPMLATGGSVADAIDAIHDQSIKSLSIVSIVSAPEGIERLNKRYPELHIITGAIDERLNERKFIVPGLGDFGDRYFGTHDVD